MNQSQFAKLMATLNLVVFEHVGDTQFIPSHPLPQWVESVFPTLKHTTGTIDFATFDPFVENFLIDARAFWHNGEGEQLASGTWTLQDEMGNNIHLEMFAMHPDECPVVVLKRIGASEDKFATLLQRGRENKLQFEDDLRVEKKLRQENQRLADLAETANKLKSEFLANMSHEIRTPMNGIIGMTELVLETSLTEEQRDYLKMVKDSAASLLILLNDILDFSKIEAGKLRLEKEHFNLRSLLEQTLNVLSIRAHEKGLCLLCDISPQVPDPLIGDSWRLRQVLVNLVGNAIKFTNQGEIVVTVKQIEQNEGMAHLLLSVSDTGIGISEENQTHIFDAFSQADGSARRHYEGTGLGLAISSQLVKMMRGEIWLESVLDKGSSFYFSLMLEVAQDQDKDKTEALSDKHILLLIKHDKEKQIIVDQLASIGMHITVKNNIESGQAALKEKTFDLILINTNLTHADAFLSAQQNQSTPVIPIINPVGDPISDTTLAYLRRPVMPHTLFEALRVAMGLKTKQSTDPLPVQTETQYVLKILIAEDNAVNQLLAKSILEKRGHHISVVSTGQEVLDFLQEKSCDLILMDVQMPDMDGYQATLSIRTKEEQTGGHIPIVAMTANALKEDRTRCLEVGMDAYISKPISAEELIETVETISAGSKRVEKSLQATSPSTSAIHAETLLSGLDNDLDLLEFMVSLFWREWPDVCQELHEAIGQNDTDHLEFLTHKLQGAIGNFGEGPAYLRVQKLSRMAKAKKLIDPTAELTLLEMEVDHLKEALDAILQASKP